MPNFLYDGVSIPAKTDKTPLPGGEDPTKWIMAVDYEKLRASILDIRPGVLAGRLLGFTGQASRPAVSGADRFLWVDTDDHLQFYDGTTDLDLSSVSSTLQGAYTAGADAEITLLGAGSKPVRILSGSVPAASKLFEVGNGALQVFKASPGTSSAATGLSTQYDWVRVKQILGVSSNDYGPADVDGTLPNTDYVFFGSDRDVHLTPSISLYIEGGRIFLRGGDGSPEDVGVRFFGGDVITMGGRPGLLNAATPNVYGTNRGGQWVGDSSPINSPGILDPSPFYGSPAYLQDAPATDASGAAGCKQRDISLGTMFAKAVGIGRTDQPNGTEIYGGTFGVFLAGAGPVKLATGSGSTSALVERLTIIADETKIYGSTAGGAQASYLAINQFGWLANSVGGTTLYLQQGGNTRLSIDPTTTVLSNSVATLTLNAFGVLFTAGAGTMNIGRNSTYRFTIDGSDVAAVTGLIASMSFTSTIGASLLATVQTSGSPTLLTLTGAAHTGLTSTAEVKSVFIDVGQTYTWATGGITTQRFLHLAAPTVAFAGASTIASAYSAGIDAPVAGTNATFTLAGALQLGATVATTYGLVVDKTLSAANNNNLIAFRRNNTTALGRIYADSADILYVDSGAAGFKLLVAASPCVYADPSNGLVLTYPGQGQIQLAFGAIVTTGVVEPAANNTYALGDPSLKWSVVYAAKLRVTDVAGSSGTPQALVLTGAAHTGMTSATEVTQVDLNLEQTYQWATGALADQRFVLVRQPTVAFAGASTLTNATTVYIDGAPLEGTNATITTRWALAAGEGNIAALTGGFYSVVPSNLYGPNFQGEALDYDHTVGESHFDSERAFILRGRRAALTCWTMGITGTADDPDERSWYVDCTDGAETARILQGRHVEGGNQELSLMAPKIGFYGGAVQPQQSIEATLTNSVTPGGTDNTIDNWTSLTVYTTDAAAIRNAIYQLARKLRLIEVGLKATSLLGA